MKSCKSGNIWHVSLVLDGPTLIEFIEKAMAMEYNQEIYPGGRGESVVWIVRDKTGYL